MGASPGALQLSIGEHSDLAGKALRAAALPEGALVTSIARDGQVLTPTGDFVLEPGDRLSLLRPDDLATGVS